MNKKEEQKRDKYYKSPYILPPECDELCRFRPCFNKYENKGSYTTGRGYTTYYQDFRPACGTRLQQGCPPHRDHPTPGSVDVCAALRWCCEHFKELPGRVRVPEIMEKLAQYLDLVGGK